MDDGGGVGEAGRECGRFIHKGSRVRVTGSLQTQSWEYRESGQKRYKTVVRAADVLFLSMRERAQDAAAAVQETVEDLPFSSDWRSLITSGAPIREGRGAWRWYR